MSDTASATHPSSLVRGEGSGGSPLGQLGSAALASAHREPGGFPEDPCRHQADHQQALGYGSPSKETWEGECEHTSVG